ncbi:hypothetical protein H8K32_10570 [Undibacterium jejuense]|uniref:TonB C-terminal domain-containing protein n=1 Tax=Undibacterium jejuense TaxID=1344949 RepID=A0A923KPX5_9BURK|nr:hypothetical protein [Undibacterium jejuense]MBC3862544.1 hypothetical protein [Undibacterium jejuense]
MRTNTFRFLCLTASLVVHLVAFQLSSDNVTGERRKHANIDASQHILYVSFFRAPVTNPQSIFRPTSEIVLPPDASRLKAARNEAEVQSTDPIKKHPELNDQRPSTYMPSSEMDIPAVPVSEPNFETVQFQHHVLMPVRLRIYVDAKGLVKDVRLLDDGGATAETLDQLQAVFYATRFIPGRRYGRDMSSYMDLEINLNDLVLILP